MLLENQVVIFHSFFDSPTSPVFAMGPHSLSSSVVLSLFVLFKGIVGQEVPASDTAQSSILSQQAYNLCLFEAISQTATSCQSFGSSNMTPSSTVLSLTSGTATTEVTFIASFLTEYGGLPCPGTTITTTVEGSYGVETVIPVGELGQGSFIPDQ